MSPADNNPPPTKPPATDGVAGEAQATAKLAHELANLVDGSLRNVGLAMATLRDTAPAAPIREDEDAIRRLQAANDALRQMGRLIHAWLGDKPPTGAFRYDDQTLAGVVEQVLQLVAPLAAQHDIELKLALSDEVLRLPAGPIYPVLANAVRNSIEAIADSGQPGRVEILGQVPDGFVELSVRDNGPGLPSALVDEHGQFNFGMTTKPDGHGLGLVI